MASVVAEHMLPCLTKAIVIHEPHRDSDDVLARFKLRSLSRLERDRYIASESHLISRCRNRSRDTVEAWPIHIKGCSGCVRNCEAGHDCGERRLWAGTAPSISYEHLCPCVGDIPEFHVQDSALGGLERAQLLLSDIGVDDYRHHRDCGDYDPDTLPNKLLLLESLVLLAVGDSAFDFGFDLMERFQYATVIVIIGFAATICGSFALTKYVAESGEYFPECSHGRIIECRTTTQNRPLAGRALPTPQAYPVHSTYFKTLANSL